MKGIAVILALAVVAIATVAQTPATRKQQFEVASVKLNTSGGPPGRLGTWGNLFIAENYPVVLVIQRAYGFPDEWLPREQLTGVPGWTLNDRFDIEAKIEGDPRAIPNGQVWLMVQSLLEDRFQLKVHHEVRQLDVFNLVVANGGLKMKLSGDQTPPKSDDEVDTFDPASPPRGETSVTHTASGETVLSGAAISISPSLEVHRPHALLRGRIRSDFQRWKVGSVFQLLGRNTRSRYVLWMPDTHRYIYRSIVRGKLECAIRDRFQWRWKDRPGLAAYGDRSDRNVAYGWDDIDRKPIL